MDECKYPEIVKLFEYCQQIGVDASLEKLFDGYAIRFPHGYDFVQHNYTYGSKNGCVEPAIGCKYDYMPVDLESAKQLACHYKDRLNGRIE